MRFSEAISVGCALSAACLGYSGEPANPEGPPLPAPERVGQVPLPELPEASGLVKSAKHPNAFWTHNDSGNHPKLYAVDGKGGLLGAWEVPGARNIDWEAVAMDERGRLLLADIGDNGRKRDAVCLYRLDEWDPRNPPERIAEPKVFRFAYPKETGPQDAEALIVRGGFAYLFTKEAQRARVYRVALPEEPPGEPAVAEFVAETAAITLVTGADLTPDGKHLALLTYGLVLTVGLPKPLEETGAPDGTLPRPFEGRHRKRAVFLGQAEGIAWDGEDLVIACEKAPLFGEGRGFWRMRKAREP